MLYDNKSGPQLRMLFDNIWQAALAGFRNESNSYEGALHSHVRLRYSRLGK
jgi:hypothetical protein